MMIQQEVHYEEMRKSNERAKRSYKFHSKHKEENSLDPDDGNSSLCSACNLPIFSTPLKETESGSGYLHEQCSNLPIDLDGSDLHPSLEPLQKQPNLHKSRCSKCDVVCGDVMYCCRDAECDFQLDVTCALPVKIMHRSHDHRLTVICCSAGFSCSACGTEHRPGLLQAQPMPLVYVYTSIIQYIAKCTSYKRTESDNVARHQHPLTLHHEYPVYNDDDEIDDDDDDVHRLPTCNGCVQFISPPFYTCSQCPKLFLHDCCACLPSMLVHPPNEEGNYPVCDLIGLDIRVESSHGFSETTCCNRLTNGFTYSFGEYNRDIICGLMPDSITHAAHAKTHVLRSSYVDQVRDEVAVCRCCNRFLSDISYNCTTCRNFSLHASCARLPATVRHVYDPHPLELVTAPPPHVQTQMETFCDACEQSLDSTQWYYGCTDCEHAFHVDCVPCLDQLSLIKYEIAVMRVAYHKCPLTLVRGHMVYGRRCGHCGEGYQECLLALKCFKCYFTIHVSCLE